MLHVFPIKLIKRIKLPIMTTLLDEFAQNCKLNLNDRLHKQHLISSAFDHVHRSRRQLHSLPSYREAESPTPR